MNVITFFNQNKKAIDLLTHLLNETAWYKNEADSHQRSQASVIKADLIKAVGNKSNKELFEALTGAVKSNVKTEIKMDKSEYVSSLGPLFNTIF